MDRDNPPVVDVDIRNAEPSDAERLLALKYTLDYETNFMMFEPGERRTTVAAARREIEQRIASGNSTLILAADRNIIAGYVEAIGGDFNRTQHLATVVAGVRASHAGRGIGSRLFKALTDWADETGLLRLELTVMVDNPAAIRLYEKFGFVREGLRRCSMMVNGRCVDELAMARMHVDFAASEPNG